MNELQVFSNEDFGSVRTLIINDQPHFVARDVATALGYVNKSDAIMKHCKGVVKRDIPTSADFLAKVNTRFEITNIST